ncbi:MAG: helix-turn-helix domain-containing protein [Blastocatellia bacterium]
MRRVIHSDLMVKWTVREVAERAGIYSANDLHVKADIHVETAYGIWNGTTRRVDFSTIDKLCRLLKVPVGQLIEFIPDAGRR